MPAPKPGTAVRGSRTGRPMMALFDLLGRRWAARIMWELRDGHTGFRTLQTRCDAMSSSVLRGRLCELADVGLVGVDEDGQYGLTKQGVELMRALAPLARWADGWKAKPAPPV